MFKRKKIVAWMAVCATVLINCARPGRPTGGEDDKTPPVMISEIPKNNTKNFKEKKIKLIFDEFVTIKDASKQIIISPPMNTMPEISPSYPSKSITIKFIDTLKENTTYSINFGNSIRDNNEANPLGFYKYVFSTGQEIDTFKVRGTIKDAVSKKTDNFVNVGLYEIGQGNLDSIFHRQKPIYITNTQDSLKSFEITNVKAGKYLLAAIKDKANNFIFNPEDDKIGFYANAIEVPSDNVYSLTLFKEKPAPKTIRPTQVSKNRLLMGYRIGKDSLEVKFLDTPKDFKYFFTKEEKKDSLHIWIPKQTDSLKIVVVNQKTDTFKIRLRKMEEDSLRITTGKKNIYFGEDQAVFNSNIPLEKIDKEKIKVIDSDSLMVDFSADFEKNNLSAVVSIKSNENKKYKVTAFQGAFTDIYQNKSDTLEVEIKPKKKEEMSLLKLNIKKELKFPIVVQLSNESGTKISYQKAFKEKIDSCLFDFVAPGSYYIRIVEDENTNGKRDTGDTLKRKQPENVYILPKPVELRANWEVEETF